MADTRELFLEAATRAFAERGFYGASIASIADTLPFTKQALLHHFGSKEKLYGEVLKRISNRLTNELDALRDGHANPREKLEATFLAFYRSSLEHRNDTELLMRELLDNPRRATTAKAWYLKPFLQTLTDMVLDVPGTGIDSRPEALAVVYQLLGAINYFAVSEPTLTRILGRQDYRKLDAVYEEALRTLLAARLERGAAG